MSTLNLDPAKTALVAIDLQGGVVGRTTVPHSTSEVMERTRRLAESLRQKGGTVVYVRVDINDFLILPVDKPFREANAPRLPESMSELVPESGLQPGDLVVTKRHWGAFAGTDLEAQLRQRGIETVVITGVASQAGVESTVRQGTGLGFAFVVAEDACAALEEAEHRYPFDNIFPRIARVRSTDEVIAAIA